ncbi:Alpha/Beta hydrolase protein [Aspergillus karnatakaensis]|uniref:Alpha/Beta hydrolase protein n=1 Tax=Aspergillus karnatakaensis TaxID=1810916 RepID=UPI003CCCA1B2
MPTLRQQARRLALLLLAKILRALLLAIARFIAPGLGLDSPYCSFIAKKTKFTVIDVGYRLAPEHPFPCALEDLVTVVHWVRSQPELYDLNRLWLGGFSSGGNIAVSVAVNYLDKGIVRGIVGLYPVVDGELEAMRGDEDVREGTSEGEAQGVRRKQRGRPEHGGLGTVPRFLMRFVRACYLVDSPFGTSTLAEPGSESGGGNILRDLRVSPIYADADRFPARCLFVTAEHDSLSTSVDQLAEKIRREGTIEDGEERRVVVHRVSGCGHAFDKGVKEGSEREKIKDEVYGVVAAF